MNISNFKYPNLLFFFYPISLILGSAIVNLILILSSLYFINYVLKNNFSFLNYGWEKIFFLFLIYIIFISFFSFEVFQSLKSSISQIRFILFSFFLSIINFKNIFESLKNILILVILFVCIDVNIQFIFGYDIFGYAAEGYSVAKYPPLSHWKNDQVILGRLSGPFGTELIPGAFISSISPPVIFYIFNNLNKKNIKENIIKIFFIIFIIFSVLLTGERLAFILICFCFLYALFFKLNIKIL